MRLQTAIDEFIAAKRMLGARPGTLRAYGKDLALFQAYVLTMCGHDRLNDVAGRKNGWTPAVVEGWLVAQDARGLAHATVSRRQTAIREFAKWALRKRYIAQDATRDMPSIRVPKRQPRPFLPQERDALMALPLKGTERVLRSLLYYTGLREGELVKLRLMHIGRPSELADGTKKCATVTVEDGKGGRSRTVALAPSCWTVVEDHALRHTNLRPTAFLLTKLDGMSPWSTYMVRWYVRRWGRAANVPACTPHRWRHTFATDALDATDDLLAVKEAMGHASVKTTEVYVKLVDRKRDRLANAMLAYPAEVPSDG